MGDEEQATLDGQFFEFAKLLDNKRSGLTITLYRSDYWMRQAKLLDDRKLTMTETGILFNKFAKSELNWDEWLEYLSDLCQLKGYDEELIKETLTNCGIPGQTPVVVPQYRDFFLTYKPREKMEIENDTKEVDAIQLSNKKRAPAIGIKLNLEWPHFSYIDIESLYCNATFDSYLCWPPTQAGAVASQNCPPARLSDTTRFAYRQCGQDGLWLGRRSEASEAGWTNYTPCFPTEVQTLFIKVYEDERDAQLKFEIAQRTRYMEIAGFSISLVALIVSLIIFSHYRSLRNNRTRIHKSLFSAMVLQVLIRLTVYIDQALVRGRTADRPANATLKGIDNMPYLCESSYILLEYAITVMFMWMFIEGLYLHNVVTANALRERISHLVYYATGWGLPIILTALWAIMTALHYKQERVNTCWYGYNFTSLYWIVQGPRLGVILINLMFLLNIMRVLIVKLRRSESTELEKVRKAARAALVLLPLLGITNGINMTEAPLDRSVWQFGLWSYGTHFLRSFQGFFIALVYCFLNGEVRQVLKKHYNNYMSMRVAHRRHRDSFFNFLSSSGEQKPAKVRNKTSDEVEFAESIQHQGETNVEHTSVKMDSQSTEVV